MATRFDFRSAGIIQKYQPIYGRLTCVWAIFAGMKLAGALASGCLNLEVCWRCGEAPGLAYVSFLDRAGFVGANGDDPATTTPPAQKQTGKA